LREEHNGLAVLADGEGKLLGELPPYGAADSELYHCTAFLTGLNLLGPAALKTTPEPLRWSHCRIECPDARIGQNGRYFFLRLVSGERDRYLQLSSPDPA
jgi:hypothetical protein